MKTAILGGSFNPIHLGHLQLAAEAEYLGYKRVILVPANIPAHKSSEGIISADLRYEMTRSAAEAYGYEVSDCEIRRGGVSYTLDTVIHLKQTYEIDGPLGLIIGEDLLNGFHEWKEFNRLLEETELLLARRGPEMNCRKDIPFVRLNNPDFPISSTEIRQRIADGRPYRFLVSSEVYRYISINKLYQSIGGVES